MQEYELARAIELTLQQVRVGIVLFDHFTLIVERVVNFSSILKISHVHCGKKKRTRALPFWSRHAFFADFKRSVHVEFVAGCIVFSLWKMFALGYLFCSAREM